MGLGSNYWSSNYGNSDGALLNMGPFKSYGENMIKAIKLWCCRNLYPGFFKRRLSEYPAVCDVCNCRVDMSDFSYMCIRCATIYYNLNHDLDKVANWVKYIPLFIFRWIMKQTLKEMR